MWWGPAGLPRAGPCCPSQKMATASAPPVEEYRITNRGGLGIKNYMVTEKTGGVVGVKVVDGSEDLLLVTRAGILNKVGHDVPVARITNVAYERSLSDRVFGCGSLVFTTSAEAPVVLTDIPKVEEVGVAISNLLFGVRA